MLIEKSSHAAKVLLNIFVHEINWFMFDPSKDSYFGGPKGK